MNHNKKDYEQNVSYYKKKYPGDNIEFLLKDRPYNTIKKIKEIKCKNPDRIISEYMPNDKIVTQDELFRKLLIEKGEILQSFNQVMNEVLIKSNLGESIVEIIDNKTSLKIKSVDKDHTIFDSIFFISDDKDIRLNNVILNHDTSVIINGSSLEESEFLKIISHEWIFQINQESSIRSRIKKILELDFGKLIFKKRIISTIFKDYFKNSESKNIVNEIAIKHKLYKEDIYKSLVHKKLLSFLKSEFNSRIYNFLDFINSENHYQALLDITHNTKDYDYKIKFFCSFYCKLYSNAINEKEHSSFVNFYNQFRRKKELPSLESFTNSYKERVSKSNDSNIDFKINILKKGLILNQIINFHELTIFLHASKLKPIDFLNYKKNGNQKIKEIVAKILELLEKKYKPDPYIISIIYISKIYENDVFMKSYGKLFLYDLIFSKCPKTLTYDFSNFFETYTSPIRTRTFLEVPIAFLIKSVYDMICIDHPSDNSVRCQDVFNFFFAHIHENNTNKPFYNFRNDPCKCAYLLLYFDLKKEKDLFDSILNSFIDLDYDMKSILYLLNKS
jgi:hypothetical protein